jgi:sugar phosphate permease
MVSIPLASAIGGPLGGALLTLNGKAGLAGWQWLFLMEGVPSIVLGIVVLLVLTDRPDDATWLSVGERRWLTTRLADERARNAAVAETNATKAMTSGVVWWLAILYFLAIAAELGPIFFGPVLLADAMHISSLQIGYVIGAIGVAGVFGMLLNGAHSDRAGERIVHSAVPMIAMAAGFALTAFAHGGPMIIAGLALISFAVNAFLPVFWCVPSMMLSGAAAAGGIAVINSIGNLGGFVAPTIVGWGKSITGNYVGSMLVLGVFAIAAAGMIFMMRKSPRLAAR